ncbi:transmembrane protein 186-like [Corticium candelabrum]|uniref:transmembrane protein 186-like n=1 Tax=Corticium candelabrum TaxID=121492 RepID=UPI002E344231|nr:transmembrane protein 186-like [Corticium candelabrum]
MYGLISRNCEIRCVLTLQRVHCLRRNGSTTKNCMPRLGLDARIMKIIDVPSRGVPSLCNGKVDLFPKKQQSVTKIKTMSNLQAEMESVSGAILVYKFPWMKHLRFISRLKQFQAGCVILLIFPISYWHHQGLLDDFNVVAGVTAATATTIMLFIISYFSRRIVGELRFHPHTGMVQLSTLTFWSRRQNQAFHCSDIIPMSETQSNTAKTWQKLEIFDHSDIYLYSLRLGKIYHQELLRQLLGIQQRESLD